MAPISYRHATREDLPAVAALARARELALHGEAETTEDELGHDWSTPAFDLARDAWVAETAEGRVVGYADVLPSSEEHLLTVWVAPDLGDASIEPALFDRCEARSARLAAAEGETSALVRCITAEDPTQAQVLADRGYGRTRTFLRMWLDADAPVPRIDAPAGVDITPIERSRDAPGVHEVLVDAFRDHVVLGVPSDLASWRHETVDDPRYVDGLSFAARRDGRIVGAVVGFPDGDHGWIRNLGVLRSERGTGIGTALLARAFDAFRAAGLPAVGLGVDAQNATGAARLYERAGMRVVRRLEVYERRIPAIS